MASASLTEYRKTDGKAGILFHEESPVCVTLFYCDRRRYTDKFVEQIHVVASLGPGSAHKRPRVFSHRIRMKMIRDGRATRTFARLNRSTTTFPQN